MRNNKIIQYIDAAIGTGKSYQLVTTILQGREISSVPSKPEAESRLQLIKQLRPDLNPIKIDSDDIDDNSTLHRVIQAMEQSEDNTVVICCHHTSFRIDNQHFYDSNYRLIVDDPESLYKDVSLPFDEVKHKFSNLFNVDEDGEVHLITKTSVHYTAPNKDIKQVMQDIDSGKWQYSYCLSRDFTENKKADEISHELIRIPSIELFPDNTLLIGEDIKNCLYFKLYETAITMKELKVESDRKFNDRTVNIHYFIGERNSMGCKQKNQDIMDRRYNKALSTMNGEPCLILKNEKDTIAASNLTKIPTNCQSMNMYQNFSNIIATFCGNMKPWSYNPLNQLGITTEDVYRDRTLNVIHQAIGRTSYRDADSSQDVNVVLLDEHTAKHIKDRIWQAHPNFKVNLIPIKGYQTVDGRINNGAKSKYSSKDESKKVRKVVGRANQQYYTKKGHEDINKKILWLDSIGKRAAIPKEPFWDKLSSTGAI